MCPFMCFSEKLSSLAHSDTLEDMLGDSFGMTLFRAQWPHHISAAFKGADLLIPTWGVIQVIFSLDLVFQHSLFTTQNNLTVDHLHVLWSAVLQHNPLGRGNVTQRWLNTFIHPVTPTWCHRLRQTNYIHICGRLFQWIQTAVSAS